MPQLAVSICISANELIVHIVFAAAAVRGIDSRRPLNGLVMQASHFIASLVPRRIVLEFAAYVTIIELISPT